MISPALHFTGITGISGESSSGARLRGRAFAARLRANLAQASLAQCRLCAHECGVNRLEGGEGPCHAGPHARVFSAQTEVADELELIPTFAIALSGCDLRCDFCIFGTDSWNARAGVPLDIASVARSATEALAQGARTIMVLGGEPSIHLPDVLELVSHLPDDATLVWKTNAHSTPQANEWLDGMFDIWNADYKFGNDVCALRLARVPNYTAIVRRNLLWAHGHSQLIVRHLVMPGHVDCCWKPVAEWIAASIPDAKVNLRTGFWPAWLAGRHEELRGTVSDSQAQRARDIARDCNLKLIE